MWTQVHTPENFIKEFLPCFLCLPVMPALLVICPARLKGVGIGNCLFAD